MSEAPNWAWDLLIDVLDYEDGHSAEHGCMQKALNKVPAEVRTIARAMDTYTRAATGPAPGSPRECDHTSVGAIIRDEDGRILTFTRNTAPVGIAGPAGHIDDHGGPEAAIIAEVAEETGLTVVHQRLVNFGYRPGACRRPGSIPGIGHDWWVFEVQTTGTLSPSARETRDVRCRTTGELQALAEHTIDYAHGRITDAEFAADPGIEPVWVTWLADAHLIRVSLDDRWRIDKMLRDGR